VTREELKDQSGKTVIVVIACEEVSAELHVHDSGPAYLTVAMDGVWAKMARYDLTDADVESLSPSNRGGGGLIGPIYLKSDGESLKWDDSAHPRPEK
jgi:hypothetical protein